MALAYRGNSSLGKEAGRGALSLPAISPNGYLTQRAQFRTAGIRNSWAYPDWWPPRLSMLSEPQPHGNLLSSSAYKAYGFFDMFKRPARTSRWAAQKN